MIDSTRVLRVLAYGQPADMRKGFDDLYGLVRTALGQDPLSGDLYPAFLTGVRRERPEMPMMVGERRAEEPSRSCRYVAGSEA